MGELQIKQCGNLKTYFNYSYLSLVTLMVNFPILFYSLLILTSEITTFLIFFINEHLNQENGIELS